MGQQQVLGCQGIEQQQLGKTQPQDHSERPRCPALPCGHMCKGMPSPVEVKQLCCACACRLRRCTPSRHPQSPRRQLLLRMKTERSCQLLMTINKVFFRLCSS